MNTWKVILATLVIFGAGVITGAMVVNMSTRVALVAPVPAPIPVPGKAAPTLQQQQQQQQTDLLHRMDKQLELTSDQHKKLEKVLKDSQKRSKVIRDQISPHLREELERVRKEVLAELTPDQQKKFETLPHNSLNNFNPRKLDKTDEDGRTRPKKGKKGGSTNTVPTNATPPSASASGSSATE